MSQFNYTKLNGEKRVVHISQDTIDLFFRTATTRPGQTVRDYSIITKYGRQLLKQILMYTPEGAELRSKGVIARGSRGRPAKWEELPGTKVAPRPTTSQALLAPLALPKMHDNVVVGEMYDIHNAVGRLASTSWLSPRSLESATNTIMNKVINVGTALDEKQTEVRSLGQQLAVSNDKVKTLTEAIVSNQQLLIALRDDSLGG